MGSVTEQRISTLALLAHHNIGSCSKRDQGEELKDIKIMKEERKMFMFADGMMLSMGRTVSTLPKSCKH